MSSRATLILTGCLLYLKSTLTHGQTFFRLKRIKALHVLANAAAPVYVPSAPRAEPLTAAEDIDSDATLPTVTVRGFLNFRTTVDGTVIVFTPASVTPQDPTPASSVSISSSSAASFSPRNDDIQHLTYTGNDKESQKRTELENEAHTPEDDRQNFRQRHLKPGYGDLGTTPGSLRNDEPQQNLQKPGATSSLPQYPTGLVTVLGGTHVKDGATTVFETKVIGTYIEGKYAQILQSTSQIIFPAKSEELSTPKPSPTKSVFQKSASPTVTSSRPVPTKPIKNLDQSSRNYRPTAGSNAKDYKATTIGSRQAERRTDDPVNANTVLQSSFKLPENAHNRQSTSPTQSLEKTLERSSYTLSRRFRPTLATDIPPEDENTVPESQNGRRVPPRHRYVLPRRNTPSVRLNRFKVKLTVRNDEGEKRTELVTPHDNTFDPEDELIDDYGALINHPVDPAKVVYEKTTITSEVTLHVGRRKSVRTLTITTSVPKTRHAYPSDVLAINDAHDISPANNNAIFATLSDEDAAPHIVVTRTYTTTERMLKTSLVPILDNDTTSYHTVTESFFILKLITGYKTLPAADMTLLLQTDTSEMDYDDSSDLLEGAVALQPSPRQQIIQTAIPNGLLQASGSGREQAIVPYEKTTKSVSDDLSNSLMSLGAALQQNPLAAVYLGLQQLNRQATLYSTKTRTSTYIHTDTIYSTKVVSFYDGRRTRTRTLSESISTTEKTMTSLTTTVEPYLNTQLFQQQNLQQLLGVSGTGPQLLAAPQQFSTVTSTYTTVTTATSLSTRVYTLIYNALSTKFRTVTSTSLYETTITATTTSEVPIAVTAPPGGVFPFLG